jgi:MoaA/NifB/PqqE/SkfB family radical SAM enzyme
MAYQICGRDLLSLWRKRIPGQLIIQITDHCNAHCPQCGMRITEQFPRSRLSVDYVKRLLDAAAQQGVRAVSFTGGEPFLMLKDLVTLITYAGKAGFTYIRTGTNGFPFANPGAPNFHTKITRITEQLAATPLRNLWISIDSTVPALHETMRGFPGVIAGIERALPIFHDHGIYPSANLGMNRNISEYTAGMLSKYMDKCDEYEQNFIYEFERAFKTFYRFIRDLGFTMASICYPMSVKQNDGDSEMTPVYAASSVDEIVRFSDRERGGLYKALLETVPKFRSELRIISPLSSLYALYHQYAHTSEPPYPCRGGIDFFFVDAREGNTYPCGYRGNENLGKLWNLDLSALDTQTACVRCDWECFRDPSELFGPILHGLSHPVDLFRKFRRDPQYVRFWLSDLKYYRACSFFDGRVPLDTVRLRNFRDHEHASLSQNIYLQSQATRQY